MSGERIRVELELDGHDVNVLTSIERGISNALAFGVRPVKIPGWKAAEPLQTLLRTILEQARRQRGGDDELAR
jgi:hypothetical protein